MKTTNTKFTPGPWRLHSTMKEVVVADGDRYSTTLCECSGYKTPREANAILIASAPELLDALNDLLEMHYNPLCYGNSEQRQLHTDMMYEATSKAKAAIAKARGEI